MIGLIQVLKENETQMPFTVGVATLVLRRMVGTRAIQSAAFTGHDADDCCCGAGVQG